VKEVSLKGIGIAGLSEKPYFSKRLGAFVLKIALQNARLSQLAMTLSLDLPPELKNCPLFLMKT
jgi:hypothetical protein